MLQIICGCGRIAEVRHKKTGRNLAYTHCLECGTDLGSIKKAAVVEAAALDNIGVKGEFQKNTSQNSVSEHVSITENFKPEPEDLPENVEPDIIKTETQMSSFFLCYDFLN